MSTTATATHEKSHRSFPKETIKSNEIIAVKSAVISGNSIIMTDHHPKTTASCDEDTNDSNDVTNHNHKQNNNNDEIVAIVVSKEEIIRDNEDDEDTEIPSSTGIIIPGSSVVGNGLNASISNKSCSMTKSSYTRRRRCSSLLRKSRRRRRMDPTIHSLLNNSLFDDDKEDEEDYYNNKQDITVHDDNGETTDPHQLLYDDPPSSSKRKNHLKRDAQQKQQQSQPQDESFQLLQEQEQLWSLGTMFQNLTCLPSLEQKATFLWNQVNDFYEEARDRNDHHIKRTLTKNTIQFVAFDAVEEMEFRRAFRKKLEKGCSGSKICSIRTKETEATTQEVDDDEREEDDMSSLSSASRKRKIQSRTNILVFPYYHEDTTTSTITGGETYQEYGIPKSISFPKSWMKSPRRGFKEEIHGTESFEVIDEDEATSLAELSVEVEIDNHDDDDDDDKVSHPSSRITEKMSKQPFPSLIKSPSSSTSTTTCTKLNEESSSLLHEIKAAQQVTEESCIACTSSEMREENANLTSCQGIDDSTSGDDDDDDDDDETTSPSSEASSHLLQPLAPQHRAYLPNLQQSKKSPSLLPVPRVAKCFSINDSSTRETTSIPEELSMDVTTPSPKRRSHRLLDQSNNISLAAKSKSPCNALQGNNGHYYSGVNDLRQSCFHHPPDDNDSKGVMMMMESLERNNILLDGSDSESC